MSDNYVLSCCSTADLSEGHFKERNISYVCFHFSLDGKEYEDDLGKSIAIDEFYQAMCDGAETRTSQVNVEEYMAYFTPFLEAGKDIPVMTMVINGYQSEQYTWINDTAAQLQVMIPFEGEEVTDNSVYTMTIPAMDTGIEGGQDIMVSWNYASKTNTVYPDQTTLPEGVDGEIEQAISQEQLGILSKELVSAAPEIRKTVLENQK